MEETLAMQRHAECPAVLITGGFVRVVGCVCMYEDVKSNLFIKSEGEYEINNV